MKFGVRECANITFKATSDRIVANKSFKKGAPVLFIDTAKTSTLEEASTTVYATGGRGNTRLIAWEGEKTLTFTVEDALLSPISLAMLTGAGLFSSGKSTLDTVHVHMTTLTTVGEASDGTLEVDLDMALGENEKIDSTAPIFIGVTDADGSITGQFLTFASVNSTGKIITGVEGAQKGTTVFVDYYITKQKAAVTELQIDAEHFAGYYYVEADTLFRRQSDGVDLPAIITLPNVKIQSALTFTMASSGDPSTFTFTMDAFPGYTYFDKTKKVLCVMQVIHADAEEEKAGESVMLHDGDESF